MNSIPVVDIGNVAVGPLAGALGTSAALIALACVAGVPLVAVAFVPSVRAIRSRAASSTGQSDLADGAALASEVVPL